MLETKQDFFENLPPEIVIDILSRLPIPAVTRCKCVCTSWLNLVKSFEFAISHVSKSVPVPGLARNDGTPLTVALFRGERIPKTYEILELVDSQDAGNHCNAVFKLNFPHQKLIPHCSANGLLLMSDKVIRQVFISNPITREYIKLPPLWHRHPKGFSSSIHVDRALGFGVSKLTGKHKVVRIYVDRFSYWSHSPPKCEVYTLGTGSWRSAAAPGVPTWFSTSSGLFLNGNIPGVPTWFSTSSGLFLNGNIHWLVECLSQQDFPNSIQYFDLETECFSAFSIPHEGHNHNFVCGGICVLRDSLCWCCDIGNFIVDIWLMDKYGDDESWRKEFVIKRPSDSGTVVPIKMFKNGDVMFAGQHQSKLYCYSSETKTMLEVDETKGIAQYFGFEPIIYDPTFFPLKTFATETVMSF